MKRSYDRMVHILYAISFFFSIHLATTAYINSSFMENFVSANYVGIIYTIGSILGIAGLLFLPKILTRFGNTITVLTLIIIHMSALMFMVTSENPAVVVWSFIAFLTTNTFIVFNFDIYLEHFTKKTTTGKTRGLYLTIMNVAWLFSPLLASTLLATSGFQAVYGIAFLLMIPVFLLIGLFMRGFRDSRYQTLSIIDTVKSLYKNKDTSHIWILNFILQFFYAWMVIYTPIYLHEHIGFSWGEIGIIFTIMLLPFVILQYPLGRISDKLGEKEFLTIGFSVAAFSLIIMYFTTSTNMAVWAIILFMTRVGASIIEVMADTYFFKKIHSADSEYISIYRSAYPIAYVIAPILATFIISFFAFKTLFLVLTFILLYGVLVTHKIHDAK